MLLSIQIPMGSVDVADIHTFDLGVQKAFLLVPKRIAKALLHLLKAQLGAYGHTVVGLLAKDGALIPKLLEIFEWKALLFAFDLLHTEHIHRVFFR